MTTITTIGKTYPVDPSPSSLRATYNDLRSDAISVLRSRSQIASLYKRERKVAEDLRAELREFAEDTEMALREKARLNAIVSKYAQTFQKFEVAGDELIAGLSDYDGHVSFRGAHPIRRLMAAVRAFAFAWKAAKEMDADLDDLNNGVL